MLFSIITVCLNAEEGIALTLDSVSKQTCTDYEHIIVDGVSTDRTLEIVYAKKNDRMRIVSEPDSGISDAFNKGVNLAKGEYLLFLNAGDYFISDNVLEMVSKDIDYNSFDMFSYSVAMINREAFPVDLEEAEHLWEKSLVPHQATFIKRCVFNRVGLYDTSLRIRMDYDFFARSKIAGVSVYLNPIVIARYDLGGISAIDHYSFEREGLLIKLKYSKEVSIKDVQTLNLLVHMRMKESERESCFFNDELKNIFTMASKINVYGAGMAGYHLIKLLIEEGISDESIDIYDTYKVGVNLEEVGKIVCGLDDYIERSDDVWVISVQDKKAILAVVEKMILCGIETKKMYIYDEMSTTLK